MMEFTHIDKSCSLIIMLTPEIWEFFNCFSCDLLFVFLLGFFVSINNNTRKHVHENHTDVDAKATEVEIRLDSVATPFTLPIFD